MEATVDRASDHLPPHQTTRSPNAEKPGSRDSLLEALRASEAKYRTLFDSIDEGFCLIEVLFDKNGAAFDYRFLEANPAFEKHTGLRVEAAVGRTMRELAPGHEDHWYEIYGRIARTGNPERFEQAAEALGRYFDVYAFRTGTAEEPRVAALFNDIVPRKKAETELAAELEAMRTLGAVGALMIPQTSLQDLYEAVNNAAMKLTGADAGTVQIFDPQTSELALLAVRGFPPDAPERFGRVSAASATSCGVALVSGIRTVVDFDDPANADPRGDLRWHVDAGVLSAQSTPLISRTGKPIGMLSTHWSAPGRRLTERETRHVDLLARQAADLIEQRVAFQEVEEARAKAESATRAKDDFLAQLSHELRTPLTPALLLSRMLAADKSLPEQMREDLEAIAGGISLQARLIDDMLDISRITSGKLSLTLAPVDLHKLVRQACAIVAPDLAEARLELSLELEAEARTVRADAVRVQQVLWNVLKNAVKFTPEGGLISVRTRNPGEGDEKIEIAVRDTGIGIAPDMIKRVFNAFTQEDHQRYRFGGLGLGLAISERLIQMHHGEIWVESDGRGKGCVFRIELPLADAAPAAALPEPAPRKPEAAPAATDRRRRILLVEDHESTRDTLVRLLRRRGHEVTEAATVRAAREIAEDRGAEFDLVVSDLGLPDGDGCSLMAGLRDTYGLAGIALSGYGMEEDLLHSRESGFFAHLIKPVDIRALESAIALTPETAAARR